MHEVRWLASPRQGGKKQKQKAKTKAKSKKQKAKATDFFMMPEGKALPFAVKS